MPRGIFIYKSFDISNINVFVYLNIRYNIYVRFIKTLTKIKGVRYKRSKWSSLRASEGKCARGKAIQ